MYMFCSLLLRISLGVFAFSSQRNTFFARANHHAPFVGIVAHFPKRKQTHTNTASTIPVTVFGRRLVLRRARKPKIKHAFP